MEWLRGCDLLLSMAKTELQTPDTLLCGGAAFGPYQRRDLQREG